ncbi:MAG: hypothetical protein HYT21_02225 [Candidatus Nealsonbacteria bacterium]|nr:hypothetical protein [Candidatus Nealsonbacteria bacterium]
MLNFTFTRLDLDVLITLIPIIASLALAFLVYTRNKNNLSNRVFSVACITILLWAAANYFSSHPVLLDDLIWIRLVLFFAVFMQFMFFLFVYLFPKNVFLAAKWKLLILTLFAGSTMAATLSPFIYTKLEIKNGVIVPLPGILMPLFAFSIFLFLGLAVYYIIKKYRSAQGDEKMQWRFILSGFSIMFFLLIISQFLSVVLLQRTDFVKFGPLFTLPFIILSAYAIIKHRLLNVRVIAAELLVGAILLILFIEVLTAPTLWELLWTLLLFLIVGILGLLLIKSILKEVQDKLRIRELADHLELANEELKTIDQTKSEFLSIASHQLRTPLTAIQGYTSMILEGSYGNLPETMKKPLENVFSSSQRLVKLVNNLLNISRIEAGRTKLEPQKILLGELISSVVQELSVSAQQKKIKLKWQRLRNQLPELLLDQEKMRQIILNILDNAIRYTNKGEVEIKAAAENGSLRISVKDTGAGMTKEEIGQLFRSFGRGKTGSRLNANGTGLGLYVAKKFVEMHGGEIWAESLGKGQGSTFNIKIPIK